MEPEVQKTGLSIMVGPNQKREGQVSLLVKLRTLTVVGVAELCRSLNLGSSSLRNTGSSLPCVMLQSLRPSPTLNSWVSRACLPGPVSPHPPGVNIQPPQGLQPHCLWLMSKQLEEYSGTLVSYLLSIFSALPSHCPHPPSHTGHLTLFAPCTFFFTFVPFCIVFSVSRSRHHLRSSTGVFCCPSKLNVAATSSRALP